MAVISLEYVNPILNITLRNKKFTKFFWGVKLKKNAKNLVFPQLAKWVVDRAKKSDRPLVRDSAIGVKYGLSLLEKLPDEYRWIYSSTQTFKNKIDGLNLTAIPMPIDYNRIIWNDYACSWEAYAIMTYWRGIELIIPSIRSLNLRELIAPAVLSRSLLELSATFLHNANTFQTFVEELPDSKYMHISPVCSTELELLTNKAIWGSRLVEKNDPLMAKNAMTTLQNLSKNPNAVDLYPVYEYLCEVAHPNMMGNARFWSHVASVDEHGFEKRVISRNADADHVQELVENTLWALAWGSAVIHNAFLITQMSIHKIKDKLK